MEKKLLKLLLSNEFFEANKDKLVRTMFPDELGSVYDTIVEGHSRYKRDLNADELRALHGTLHPTQTRAARENIFFLIDEVAEENVIGNDVGADVLHHMWRMEVARQISQFGLDLMDGRKTSLAPLQELIARTGDNFQPEEEVASVPDDIESVIEALETRVAWKINVPTVAALVPGISEGEFMIIFARPEAGKTASWVSLCAAPNGWAWQGASIHVVCNEEPAIRTRMRLICAATGMTKEDVRNNIDLAKKLYEPIRGKIHLIDDVDMTVERLDAYAKSHRPDILIADQLDKLGVSGTFARTDEKLREIYLRAREVAKRHGTSIVGISQASADAQGRTILDYSQMENSKTGKAAEADVIIGIGKNPPQENHFDDDKVRYWTVSKNKVTGQHKTALCMIQPEISRYAA